MKQIKTNNWDKIGILKGLKGLIKEDDPVAKLFECEKKHIINETMTKIKIEIENCKGCPHFYEDNGYSTDSFDFMVDWNCKRAGRKIQGAVEWHEEKHIDIPDWCPIKVDEPGEVPHIDDGEEDICG